MHFYHIKSQYLIFHIVYTDRSFINAATLWKYDHYFKMSVRSSILNKETLGDLSFIITWPAPELQFFIRNNDKMPSCDALLENVEAFKSSLDYYNYLYYIHFVHIIKAIRAQGCFESSNIFRLRFGIFTILYIKLMDELCIFSLVI